MSRWWPGNWAARRCRRSRPSNSRSTLWAGLPTSSNLRTSSSRAPGTESAQIVRIRDVARVELSQQTYSNFAGMSGHPRHPDRHLHLARGQCPGGRRRGPPGHGGDEQRFPAGPDLLRLITTPPSLWSRPLHDVYKTLFEAGLLVLIVIMVFLQNWRATLVPATTVPVTIIGAFAAMMMLGFRHQSDDPVRPDPVPSASWWMTPSSLWKTPPTISSTACLRKRRPSRPWRRSPGRSWASPWCWSRSFCRPPFLPGITGQLFRQFALVIASTAVISAINALTLKPAQCALWLRPKRTKNPTGSSGASTGSTATWRGLISAWSPGWCRRPYHHAAGVHRHYRGERLAVRLPTHRVFTHRRPGLCHHRRPPPGRGLPAPGQGGVPRKSATF